MSLILSYIFKIIFISKYLLPSLLKRKAKEFDLSVTIIINTHSTLYELLPRPESLKQGVDSLFNSALAQILLLSLKVKRVFGVSACWCRGRELLLVFSDHRAAYLPPLLPLPSAWACQLSGAQRPGSLGRGDRAGREGGRWVGYKQNNLCFTLERPVACYCFLYADFTPEKLINIPWKVTPSLGCTCIQPMVWSLFGTTAL